MKLYNIRGGDEKELYNKNYNIGIGISLGNKWFTPEKIVRLIEWSLQYTKDFVVVYVADTIHAINIEVRNRRSSQKAKKMSLKIGDKILQETKILAEKNLSHEQLSKIHYARWNDLTTHEYQGKVKYLYDKYKNDQQFRNEILKFVENHIKNEERTFSAEDKQKLGTYILEELPELLNRVTIKNFPVDAVAYPFDTQLFIMIEKIQNGELLHEIKERIMDTQPKVFLEVRD